ncbi:MAG: hypothetical protein KF764_08525 [Labilithrix sp.]|nr:hypothetical protein [Labilithrix sp.]
MRVLVKGQYVPIDDALKKLIEHDAQLAAHRDQIHDHEAGIFQCKKVMRGILELRTELANAIRLGLQNAPGSSLLAEPEGSTQKRAGDPVEPPDEAVPEAPG